MNFLKNIKDSPHYQRLKNSAQYRFDRRQFTIISVCYGIILLIFLPLLFLAANGSAAVAAFVWLAFLLIAYGALWAYYAYQWLEIFRHMDSYIFFQVRLDQPHVNGRGGASFTVQFTDRHGKQLQRETSKMFSSQWEPFLEEYNNQMVLIGYNEATDRLVVIKRAEQ